jgi:hypothetical protein
MPDDSLKIKQCFYIMKKNLRDGGFNMSNKSNNNESPGKKNDYINEINN